MPYTFRHGSRPLEGITVQRAVGRGGFGEVYYALTDSGKQIALKYLRENPEIELRGISHVMNLKSPYLITIYDVRKNAHDEPFVIMEYISGPSLHELMTAEPKGIGAQKAAYFIDGIAQGLAYLHERGIVHRDLKPANIFYDDGYVKIGDYGLAKHISVSKHSGQTVSVGTVHYMAPEIGSGSYTKAIDIYALGVILFEMLTGELPFTGSSMGEILMRHLSDRPDLSGIPEPFAPIIAKALAKDPNDRYQDASEMSDALRQIADVSASIASFDPTSLNDVPRQSVVPDADVTLTTPPRVPPPPPPAMDVRTPAAAGDWPDRLSSKLQEKADKLAHKFEKKLHKHGGGRVVRRGMKVSYVPPGLDRAAEHLNVRGRKGQLFVLLAVSVAVAIGLSVLNGGIEPEERPIALALCIIAGALGPLLTYFKFLRQSPGHGPMWDRLAYTGVTALCMIPAFGVASDLPGPFMNMMLAPLVVLFLCDWTSRIESGRYGEVNGGQAVWPAVIGAIAAAIFTDGRYMLAAAGVCATMSFLTQAGAALWPYTTGTGGPDASDQSEPVQSRRKRRAWHHREPATSVEAHTGASHGAIETSLVPRSDAARVIFGILSTLALIGSLGTFFALVISPPSCRDDCSGMLFAVLAGVAWLPFLLTKTYQHYKMPLWRGTMRMFVVSAALCLTAGMISIISFQRLHRDELAGAIFGLVAGCVIALVALFMRGHRGPGIPVDERDARPHSAENQTTESKPPPQVLIDASAPSFILRTANAGIALVGVLLLLIGLVLALGHETLREQAQSVMYRNQIHSNLIVEGLPGPVLLGIPLAGSLLLVLARRRSGGAHMLRGCLGCAMALWAAVMALGPAANDLHTLFSTNDWSRLPWQEIAGPLMATALPLIAALLLLIWPQRRSGETIVV